MTKEEIIAELQSLVRQSNDAVLLNQTVYETFLPLYTKSLEEWEITDGKPRCHELYNNVYNFRDQANNMRKDAKLFQEVIDLINRLESYVDNATYNRDC